MTKKTATIVEHGEESVFLGVSNRVLSRRGGAPDDIGLADVTVAPGGGAPRHTNTREAVTWYVLDGTMTFELNGEMVDAAEGAAVFFPQGATHTFLNRSDRPARALFVCTPGGFEGFLLELGGRLPEEAPAGPPSPEVIGVLTEVAERYGLQLHMG
jgi:quercetin dioxygenase-like cupin family protein